MQKRPGKTITTKSNNAQRISLNPPPSPPPRLTASKNRILCIFSSKLFIKNFCNYNNNNNNNNRGLQPLTIIIREMPPQQWQYT